MSPEELHAALFVAGWNDDAVYGVFQAIDRDQDGRVSKDEWIDYRKAMPTSTAEEKAWAAEVAAKGMGVDPSLKAKEVLAQYDEDKDGGLNQRELAKFIRAVNEDEVLNTCMCAYEALLGSTRMSST